MSNTARQADVGFDAEDPRCNDGGPACEGCLMVWWCIGDYPPAETVSAEREYACCGALENGPHKMGCDYKMHEAAAAQDANANLIAAAPNLLAEVIRLRAEVAAPKGGAA